MRRMSLLGSFRASATVAALAFVPGSAAADPDPAPDVRHYMVMFAGDDPAATGSHTWATFVEVKDGAIAAESTISWMPREGFFGPNHGMPLFATVPGHNYDLDSTLAIQRGHEVRAWGPYAITDGLYERAVRRVQYLEGGAALYKLLPLDPGLRAPALRDEPNAVINCIMAVSDIDGFLDTGTEWGVPASLSVLRFFVARGDLPGYPATATRVATAMHLVERVGHELP